MPKSKDSRFFVRFFFRLLGWSRGRSLLAWYFGKKLNKAQVSFPLDPSGVKKVLLVIPLDPLEALQQVPTILSLLEYFESAEIVLFCTDSIALYFSAIERVSRVEAYRPDERFMGSTAFHGWTKAFRDEKFDLCVLLERRSDLPMLALVAGTHIPLRVGFTTAAEFPFLNLSFHPGDSVRYLPEQNLTLARLLGASAPVPQRWSSSKKAREEITLLLRESNIAIPSRLIGIDAAYYFSSFGEAWTEELFKRLRSFHDVIFYIQGDWIDRGNRTSEWLSRQRIPVFGHLSISQTAALIEHSVMIISGKTSLFELSRMMNKPTVGVFRESEIQAYLKPGKKVYGITYETAPDDRTVEQIADIVANITSRGTKG